MLRLSDNRRFLVQHDGSPFFCLGDTAWELFHRLSLDEAEHYLRDRAAKRFTVIQAVVLAELDGLHVPNMRGDVPLIDDDPARPSEACFEHVDAVVALGGDRPIESEQQRDADCSWSDTLRTIPGASPGIQKETTMHDYEYGAGLWMFQQFVDRYATDAYGPPVGTLEAIERAAEVGDIRVLDINFPFAGDDVTVEQVRDTLERTGLRAQAITPHLYMREYQLGSFTNPDPAVRRHAVDLGKRAVEVARALDAGYVKFWPGQDGYDYPFQVDYARIWDRQIGGVREVAESAPEMQFAIEYKLKEPRVHMLFGNAARTLLAIEDMGVDNVGIVLDLGHSFFAKETPADVLHLVSRRGKLVSVEVNDNWREWDDDMAVGSVHLIETLEFMHALRQIDWQGPILLDQFPFREDPIAAARSSIATIRGLQRVLERLDAQQLAAAQERQDALAAQRLVLDMLVGSDSQARER